MGDRGSGCGYDMQLLRLVLGVDALLCREGGGRERLKCSSLIVCSVEVAGV